MPKIVYLLFVFGLLGCTKEVNIDIPGFQEMLVIDGSIETGMPPIIFISKSKDIYASTNLNAFLNGFQTGAIVTVNNGTSSVVLDEICADNLPPGTETIVADLLGIPVSELPNYHLCAYTTFNTSIWGEVGKTYALEVTFEGKTYTSSTKIENPTNLNSVFWQTDKNYSDRGYSWANLSDNPSQYDAYKWEVKRLNTYGNSTPIDTKFTTTFNPVFDDEFMNGKTFNFFYENPMTSSDDNIPSDYRGYFLLNDTVVIKLSKMERKVYEFMEKKYVQMGTAGNPFATPTNVTTNITGGAIGVWAGYSPTYDTLICKP